MVRGEPTRRVRQHSRVALVICLFVVVAGVPTGIAVASAQEFASCSLTRSQIQPGEEATLDASASENATAYRYARDEDASFGPWRDTPQFQFVYDEAGTYHPRVEVRTTGDATEIASCGTLYVGNRPPNPDFTYSPADPETGEAVTFTSTSSDPNGEVVEYEWRINGQVVSRERRVVHTFGSSGDNLVELVVWDDDGTKRTANEFVTVGTENRPPTANITVAPSAPSPGQEVTINANPSDPDGNVTDVRWRVDGEVVSTSARFTYTFTEAGDHRLNVTVLDDAGATSASERVVTVTEANSPPRASISASPSSPTVGVTVSFTATASDPDGTITGYEWRLDGEVVSNQSATEYTFTDPGTHRVSLAVVDDDGASATVDTTVSVAAPTPTPRTLSATADWWYTPATPRSGERISLIAEGDQNTSLTYQWDVGADGSVERTGVTVGYTFADPGTYEVTLRVVGPDGARTTTTQRVTVQEGVDVPETGADPPFVMVPQTPRPGEAVTLIADSPPGAGPIQRFEWDLDGDGETDRRGRTVTVRFPETNRTVVTLGTTYQNGTVQGQSSTLSTNGQPTVNRTGRAGPSLWTVPSNPRPNQTVTLVADPAAPSEEIDAYRWDLDGDNVTDSQGATVTYTYASDGQYRVRLAIDRSNGTSAAVERVLPVGDAARPSDAATPASDTSGLLPDGSPLGVLGGVAVAGVVAALLVVGWRRMTG